MTTASDTPAKRLSEAPRHDMFMLLGFALFQVWVTLCFFTPQLFPDRAADGNRVYELSLVVSVVALVALSIFHKPMANAFRLPAMRWGLAACAALGTAIVPFCFENDSLGLLLTLVAALLTGVATALFNVAWCQEFAEQGDVTDFALSVVVSSIIVYVLTTLAYSPDLSPWIMLVLSIAIPFVTAGLLIGHTPSGQERVPLPIVLEIPSRTNYLARLCIGVLVISFTDEFLRNFYLNGTDLAFYSSQTNLVILIFKVVVSAMAVWAIERSKSEDFAFLYRASFLLALVAALLLPYASGMSAVPYAITNCGAFLFKITVLLVSIEFCVTSAAPPVLVFAIVRGVWSLALLLGFGAFNLAGGFDAGILSTVLVIFAAIAYVFVFTPLFGRIKEEVPVEATGNDEAFPTEPEASHLSTEDICQSLVESAGLSPRETDVLLLLARGRTTSRIEAELHISTNTANTHIKHVFAKLGVHSRQELLDLIDSKRSV